MSITISSAEGQTIVENWIKHYREWEEKFEDYKITYQKWKNDECPGN